MYAKVRAPGSCGELVQGVINGKNFLVTCPVNQYSEVCVKLVSRSKMIYGSANKYKAFQAVSKVFDAFGWGYGAEVKICSQLPAGKGMASSTADLSAAALAAALALDKELTLDHITKIALEIEPSDGTFLPGIVMFDHLKGSLCQMLGQPPKLKICIVDPGGEVDTVEFNQKEDLWEKNLAKEKEIKKAVQLITQGIEKASPKLIGEAATISSLANQAILYKPGLEKLVDQVLSFKGYGVNIAHSGTVIGILIDENDDRVEEWEKLIQNVFNNPVNFYWNNLIGGGLEVLEVNYPNEKWCSL
ncbi:GHMP kinase [Bacillota bacterium LX-D]|nr:GHMP kinase [Bacillota bacterium LX-D]